MDSAADRFSNLLVLTAEAGGAHEGGGLGAQLLGRHWRERGRKSRSDANILELGPGLVPQDHSLSERELELTFISKVRTSAKTFLAHPGDTLIFSATHAATAGIVSALHESNKHSKIGLVWCDAHPDFHTFSSSTSGRLHGMGLALSVGLADADDNPLWKSFNAQLGITKNTVTAIGVGFRDFEEAERRALEQSKIPLITCSDIIGNPASSAQKVLAYLSGVDKIIVSFDIDVVDANVLPGSASPAWFGPSSIEMAIFLRTLVSDPRVKVFEVTEYNSAFDCFRFGLHQILSIVEFVLK